MSACPHVELAIAAGNNVIARPVVALALLGATKELGTTKRELGTAKELSIPAQLGGGDRRGAGEPSERAKAKALGRTANTARPPHGAAR
jgi:hypothetical protein